MITKPEKTNIIDKVTTIGRLSNALITLSEKDGANYQIAIIVHGMIKDLISWVDNMEEQKSKVGMRRRTQAEMALARQQGKSDQEYVNEDDEDEEEEDDDEGNGGLSKMQIAAKNLTESRFTRSMQTIDNPFSKVLKAHEESRLPNGGPRYRGGRKKGSKNKPK